MRYEQFYYSWAPSGISQYNKKGGYGIAASSNGNSDFLRKCESIALNKKPELTGMDMVTEYFQYVESLKTYVFAGIYQIESPEEMRGRDNSLAHVFVPAETVDMGNPSSYIRRMNYTSIHRLEAGMDVLPQQEIPECGFDYQKLLKKYNLTDCSRLAVLLSMEFEGYFADSKRAIVFPLDDSEPERFFETAREVTWLLHNWVPDCLRKSAVELRQKLGYVVAGNTNNKNCLCFVPERGEIESSKQRFDLRVFYDCNDKKNIARGAEFYYELAKRAQKSPQAVTELIGEICSLLPEAKSINRILDAFECHQLHHMEAGEKLPDWDAAGMKKKLDRAKKNDILAKEYCIDYLMRANQFSQSFSLDSRQLKECWEALAQDGTGRDVKLERKFRPLVPIFLDMSYQFCSQSKSGDWKAYLEKLKLLEDNDSEMWVNDLYRREGGCIHEHLSRIVSETGNQGEDGAAILEECLYCYGVPLGGDPQFRREIFACVQELYSRGQNSPAVRRRIDRCVRGNQNVFDLDRWEELVIELLPADSVEFCEKYQELKSKTLKKQWLEKASESLEKIYEELAQALAGMPSKRSKGFAGYQSRLNVMCKSWLRLAVNYRMAAGRKPVIDWEWIYEKLNEEKQGDFYSSFVDLLAGADWTEDEKDIRILANQLEIYGGLRRYLAQGGGVSMNSGGCIRVVDLETYAEGYRKHVLEEKRQKELEGILARDAMDLYEKKSALERKQIRRCMENIPSWEREVDRKFACCTLEEFLKLPPDLEEDYPDKWEREHAKFAQILANYDAILKKRSGMNVISDRSGMNGTPERKRDGSYTGISRNLSGKAQQQREMEEPQGGAGKSLNEVVKFQNITENPKSRPGRKPTESAKKGTKDEGNQIILNFLNK